jgi:phage baseplate assembly protein W
MGSYGETILIASPFFRRLSDDQTILSQAIVMRLSTKRGTLWADPSYGLAVQDYLQAELTQDALVRIPFEIQAELEKDERIASVSVTSRMEQSALGGIKLFVDLIVTPLTGDTFPLTLAISELTVELITRGAN